MQYRRENYLISTDKDLLQVNVVINYLQKEAYWAVERSWETVQRSIDNSLCFGLYDNAIQVGFARVVTDYAIFAYLCDLFIVKSHQGQGLGKWLIECVTDYLDEEGIAWTMLATRDAQGLYEDYGIFQKLPLPEKWMGRVNPRLLKSSHNPHSVPVEIV
jgi:GNAT superfamily N-acetyltransferase